MIIRWHKDHDYYIVRIYQDLMGDWIVTQSWGNCATDKGSYKHTVTDSYLDARELLKKISKQRKKKGFQHLREETQLGFEFS